MNIKNLFITFVMMMVFCVSASAAFIDNFTTDSKIKNSLILLEQAGAEEVFANLEENSVKIAFYDLSQISYSYMNHFAVNSIDSFGNRYILINSRFKNASNEEIACIIAHESFHKLSVATYEEEYLATEKEAYYWSILKKQGKTYDSSELLSRLNNLQRLHVASNTDNNLIKEKINNSSFYKKQLAVSSLPNFATMLAR